MRRIFIFIAIAFQFLVLAYMAGEREILVRISRTVYLRTAPIDPRDIFRGDFVRLNYEISTIAKKHLNDGLISKEYQKGLPVYTVLDERPDGLAEILYCTDEKPAEGIFIKGRITDSWRFQRPAQGIAVKYGIETYFVEQGKGLELEKRMGRRDQLQIPLEMEIALGSNGKAIIKGHRFSPLGMSLSLSLDDPQKHSAMAHMTLVNVSSEPLALVILPDHCSISLEATTWANNDWIMVNAPEPMQPEDPHVIVLEPQETYQVEIDLSEPRWYVNENESPDTEIGLLPFSETFRLVYRPPDADVCRHLEKKDLIWHGYLPSSAFHGRGRVD